jgi:hypothetical protein
VANPKIAVLSWYGAAQLNDSQKLSIIVLWNTDYSQWEQFAVLAHYFRLFLAVLPAVPGCYFICFSRGKARISATNAASLAVFRCI